MNAEDYHEMMEDLTEDLSYDAAMALPDGDPQIWTILGLESNLRKQRAACLARWDEEGEDQWLGNQEQFWNACWESAVEVVLMSTNVWGNTWGVNTRLYVKLVKAKVPWWTYSN